MSDITQSHKSTFSDWQGIFKDIDAVQIILYLRKHNPEIGASNITKALLIDEARVIDILSELRRLDAVEYSKETKNWALTDRGRNVANCLIDFK